MIMFLCLYFSIDKGKNLKELMGDMKVIVISFCVIAIVFGTCERKMAQLAVDMTVRHSRMMILLIIGGESNDIPEPTRWSG